MNRYWRIHIDLSREPGAEMGEEFYLDATDFDLDSLLEEAIPTKRAVLTLLKAEPEEDQPLDEALRAAATKQGDALLVRLFWDDCINASVRFSRRPGAPHFEAVGEPVDNERRELLTVKHGVEFGRIRPLR